MGTKTKPLKSLKSGRPPMARPTQSSISRKASRTLINRHHQLEKKRQQAAANSDTEAEAAIAADVAALGGLDLYQLASLQGQSLERGGDTSRTLLEWLPTREMKGSLSRRLRMLEIGSLSTRNACSTSGLFDMVHIDLNSQEPGILQQDFMERLLPGSEADKFDILSLSLVLNFVPDAAGRGRMLCRTLPFLRTDAQDSPDTASLRLPFPALFIVLPRSCITNSRYFTERRMGELMGALGYELVKAKMSQKLAYTLWTRVRIIASTDGIEFTKREISPGRSRNNFVITLSHPASKGS